MKVKSINLNFYKFYEQGFTLVEMMIVTAIASVVSLGLAGIVVNAVKSQSDAQAKFDLNEAMQELKISLKNSGNCKGALENLNLTSNGSASTDVHGERTLDPKLFENKKLFNKPNKFSLERVTVGDSRNPSSLFSKPNSVGPLPLAFTFKETGSQHSTKTMRIVVLARTDEDGKIASCNSDIENQPKVYASTDPEIAHSQEWKSKLWFIDLGGGSIKAGSSFSEKCPGDSRMIGTGITLGNSQEVLGLKIVCVDPKYPPKTWPSVTTKPMYQTVNTYGTMCTEREQAPCSKKNATDSNGDTIYIERCDCLREEEDTSKILSSTQVHVGDQYTLNNSALGSAGYVSSMYLPFHQDSSTKWYTCPEKEFVTGVNFEIGKSVFDAGVTVSSQFKNSVKSLKCAPLDLENQQLRAPASTQGAPAPTKEKGELDCLGGLAFSGLHGIYVETGRDRGILSLGGTCGSF